MLVVDKPQTPKNHALISSLFIIPFLITVYEMSESSRSMEQEVKLIAQRRCQRDQWQVCESPRGSWENPLISGDTELMLSMMWKSINHDTLPIFVSATTTWIWSGEDDSSRDVPENQQSQFYSQNSSSSLVYSSIKQQPYLRSELARYRHLTEKPVGFTSKIARYPSFCLHKAWREENVRPECSIALDHLEIAMTMQQQQELLIRVITTVIYFMWIWHIWSSFQESDEEILDECETCSCLDNERCYICDKSTKCSLQDFR